MCNEKKKITKNIYHTIYYDIEHTLIRLMCLAVNHRCLSHRDKSFNKKIVHFFHIFHVRNLDGMSAVLSQMKSVTPVIFLDH